MTESKQSANQAKLLIHNVKKSFGDNHVLKEASAEFVQGRIYALLGRNGSGKTTLFDLIANKKGFRCGRDPSRGRRGYAAAFA